jgi:UDP-N-acetylmuramoyl-L-alanyl-D-glutamate--2,6-diaminopimelate ligase
MKLAKLIKSHPGARLCGDGNTEITGLHYDSRRIEPGMLFVAISGYRQDGKQFIPDAIKNGAAAILTDVESKTGKPEVIVKSIRRAMSDLAACFYEYPGRKLKIIGVTGTNGKSTSVFLIRKILERAGIKAGMINSLVYDTSIGKYKAERTTPDSIEVQKYLYEMEKAGCEYAVLEVSSHALVLNRVDNINFKIGLFTNISRDHLDFHQTMEQYLEAKKLLLGKLDVEDGIAVINRDIPEFDSIISETGARIITYSAAGVDAGVVVNPLNLTAQGTVFQAITSDESCKVNFNLPGRYNMINAAGAIAVGIALGIDFDCIKNAMETAEPVPGRFQPVNFGQPFLVLIDYAHTPDALERLCQSAREITRGRILTLFGCGGDRDRGKRPLMAEAASRCSDLVILTSDNPRTENPEKIFADTLPGMARNNYEVIADRRLAIDRIIGLAAKYDTVLIAGKGAEDYQEIGTLRYPFEDRVEIIRALEKLGYNQVKAG